MQYKFDFLDIVKIISNDPKLASINNQLGVIMGNAINEETNELSYAVSIYSDGGHAWRLYEKDLQSTGEKAREEDFYTGESIRVSVDPITGEGKIIDKDD